MRMLRPPIEFTAETAGNTRENFESVILMFLRSFRAFPRTAVESRARTARRENSATTELSSEIGCGWVLISGSTVHASRTALHGNALKLLETPGKTLKV